MIPSKLKRLYYAALSGPMAVSCAAYRILCAPKPGADVIRVHPGPGQNNYLDGWYNVDANLVSSRPDVWADLRRKLPFRDRSVDAFYSHHVIEHLPDSSLPAHCADLLRCLKPGGIVRIGGPNGDAAARKLLDNDKQWFYDFPDKRRSVGGRFVNFVFCRGEHLTMLTQSYLRELLEDAGFVDITVRRPRETGEPSLFDAAVMEKEEEPSGDLPWTLLVEARRP
jgi:predicted SAM-dependent methyltransferase